MSRLVVRIIINAVALWVAARLLGPEVMRVPQDVGQLVIVALVFGVVNALIRPVVNLFTCLLNLLTLGLFTFIINALMLMLTSWLTGDRLEFGNFGWAIVGGIIVSIVSTILSWFFADESSRRRENRR